SRGEILCWGRWVEVVGVVWSGGVGWKVGESGVKGMAGKPGSGATVPAISNVGDEKYCVGLGTLHG
nr:hypothetical protein [Tanacetum cinerariifolium]